MISCRKSKDMMIEALYGELAAAEKQALDAHLRSCPDCASEYSVLGATLRVMDGREQPDPGPAFWNGYWDRLAAKMDKGAGAEPARHPLMGRFRRAFAVLPRWSYQAAAGVVLLVLGVLAGRSIFAPGGKTSPSAEPSALTAVSNDPAARARRFLERSQVLLLGLVNYDPKTQDLYGLDVPGKKSASRELAAQAADIQSSLKEPRQRRLRALVAELQVILMQIANLDAGNDLDGIAIVKQGVEQGGIFLKIDLARMAWNSSTLPGPSPGLGQDASRGADRRKDKDKI